MRAPVFHLLFDRQRRKRVDSKYTVLIVDDEKPARELVKTLVDWQEYGFIVCGEAKNGLEGYQLYEKLKPDLIITDIDMPVLDGLEFIRKVRQTDAAQKFIILSCYEEFAFAREAIRLNVDEYMIKDLLTKEEIINQLCQFSSVSKHQSEEEAMDVSQEDWEINSRRLKHFIVNGAFEDAYLFLRMQVRETYGIMVVSIDDYKRYQLYDPELDKGKMKSGVLDTLCRAKQENSHILEFAHIGKGMFIVITRLTNTVSEGQLYYELTKMANAIRYIHSKEHKETLTIAMGRTFSHAHELEEAFHLAMDAIRYRLYLGRAKNISYNSSIVKSINTSKPNVEKLIDEVQTQINNRNLEGAIESIIELFSDKNTGFIQYHYLMEVNEQLVMMFIEMAREYEVDQKELMDENISPLHDLDSMDTIAQMRAWFVALTQQLIGLLQEKEQYSRHVLIAKQYIEEHMCEAVSLSDISDYLHLHKVYLARIFKKEMGVTITQYIHVVRVNEAKKLIRTTNLKLYEIAEQIGYANTHYFFVVFKKICGITASNYREKYKIVNIEQ